MKWWMYCSADKSPLESEKESSEEQQLNQISSPKRKRSRAKENNVVGETLEVDINIKTVKQNTSVESSDTSGMSSC